MTSNNDEMIVTPWKVSGKIDYDKLIAQFGTQPLTEEILQKIKKYSGKLHFLLRRKFFFCHRDLDKILNKYEEGEKFFLYTGRGPSGPVHLGHILPWIFTKHLQDVFGAKLYFQMTDDEKFLIRQGFTLKKALNFTYENSLDLIALGFKKEKTKIISDVKNIKNLYEIAIKVAKHINFSTVKAVFGFEDSTNVGLIFFPALQAVPAFLETELTGHKVSCLIPAAIDQDPYWRVTRDVAAKLGYPKPAQIHGRFLPGLGTGGKMSASEPETCIFTTDTPKVASKKIYNAFTGGKPTANEQKKLGGKPDICTIYKYKVSFFDDDDDKVMKLWRDCKAGNIICGNCKEELVGLVNKFLMKHQEKREKAKEIVDDYFLKSV